MSTKTATSLITRRLYRNLLRTVEPFTAPSPNAAVLTSLLHRSGIDDHIQNWAAYVEKDKNHRTYQRLFRRLLRVIMTGMTGTSISDRNVYSTRPWIGYETTVFPSKVDTTRLRKMIRNEFRAKYSESQTLWASSYFDDATRQKVAFCAIRELNKKLSYYEWLKQNSPEPMYPKQAAQNVSSLPTHPPASYLRPGVFLVSHPYMQNSYFSRSVICILEHKGLGSVLKDGSPAKKDGNDDDEDDEDIDDVISEVLQGELELDRVTLRRRNARRRTSTPPGQTYGVIVNRVSQQIDTGQNRTLKEVFREHALPERLADAFGKGSMVREGGPVHVALQMIHTLPSSENDVASDVGGTVIPYISSEGNDESSSYDDKTTYFQGNMFKAISNVEKGTMHKGKSL